MNKMLGSLEYSTYNKNTTMNTKRDEVMSTIQTENNGGMQKKWQRRNYGGTSFMNSNTYRQQDAYAVFSIGMNGNQSCNHSCQAPPQQQSHSHCVMPIFMGNQEDDSGMKEECEYLRMRVKTLEGRAPEIKVVKEVVQVQDNSKINSLETENQKLRFQLSAEQDKNRLRDQELSELKYKLTSQEQQYKSDLANLQNTLKDYEKKMIYIANELDRLNALLRQKDEELADWKFRYEELESSSVTVIQEKVTYLSNEVEVWKQRFIKLNKDFHVTQEEYIMCQAELDAVKKQGQSVREVTVKEVRRSGITTTFSTVDPQQTTFDIVRQVQDGVRQQQYMQP